jgi:protein required for attachment to host cells
MHAIFHTTRVLVANPGGASMYEGRGSGVPLRLTREIDHTGKTSAEREAQRFALRLVDELEHERIQGAFERLALVAPPQLLELIRGSMPGTLRGMLVATLDKDMRDSRPEMIHEELSEEAMI